MFKKVIIGLSGKKQSGKTTAVNYLKRKYPEAKEFQFAKGLKDIVKNCFGATDVQVNGTDVDKRQLLFCRKSSRELLQLVGTDWFRKIDDNCWVNYLASQVAKTDNSLIIISDVRFKNEVNWIEQ